MVAVKRTKSVMRAGGRLPVTALVMVMFMICAVPVRAEKKLIAAVVTSDLSRYREAHRAFVRTLSQRGYDPGVVDVILQTPNPDPVSWANTIRKFEALRADIIVTYGAPITLAAMRQIEDIPIVFVDVYGPVETGISRSMSMTGKNLSGVSSKVPMVTLIKTVQGFKQIRNLGVIYNSREAGSLVQFQEMKRIAAQQGFAVIDANLMFPSRLQAAVTSMASRVDCIYISECSIGSRMLEKIVAIANVTRSRSYPRCRMLPKKGLCVTSQGQSHRTGATGRRMCCQNTGRGKAARYRSLLLRRQSLSSTCGLPKRLIFMSPFGD